MPPYITKQTIAVLKSELLYTIIVCAGFYFWFDSDGAKANIIPSWLPYLKTINIIIIWIAACFSAKKVVDFRAGLKKVIEKGDIEAGD